MVRYLYGNHISGANFTEAFASTGLPMHVDLPRLRAGQNGGAFWSVYAPCPANGTDYAEANYLPIVQFTLQQIDMMTRLTAAYPADFSALPAISSAAAVAAFRRGRLIAPLGIEGLHQVGNSAATLRRFHALGVRYATLTHNCGNVFADAAIWEYPEFGKAPAVHGGVSPLGRRLVREMNRLGMIVDLSHVSVDTMLDVLGGRPARWAGSVAPIIFSHSSAYALCPHPRNVPDDVLKLVRDTHSVVMGTSARPPPILVDFCQPDSFFCPSEFRPRLTSDNPLPPCRSQLLARLHLLRRRGRQERHPDLLPAQLDSGPGRQPHHLHRRPHRLRPRRPGQRLRRHHGHARGAARRLGLPGLAG